MSSYADTLEALSKAATARPFKALEIKGNGFYQTAGSVRNLDGKAVMHYCVCHTCTTFPRSDGLALIDMFIDLANHVEDFVRLFRDVETLAKVKKPSEEAFATDWGEVCDSMITIARDALAAFEETK